MPVEVPKFIEREPRIVGPLTLKQFAYIGVAGAATFAAFFLIDNMLIFLPIGILFVSLGVSLAFIKVNGKPLPMLLMTMLSFGVKPQRYVWKKQNIAVSAPPKKEEELQKEEQIPNMASPTRIQRESKVSDLATKIKTS